MNHVGMVLVVVGLMGCESSAPPAFQRDDLTDADTQGDADTLAGACEPGDSVFCNGQGRCDPRGADCICDDPEHYSPEDNCRDWRQHVRNGDTFCTPGDRGACNDHGECDGNGMRCVCDDPEHYTPFDDCSHLWDRAPQPPDPDRPDWPYCEPGTRAVCHGNGACNPTGTGCVCDDPDHYRPDDDCNTWHQGPPEADGGDTSDDDANEGSDASGGG